MKKNFKTFKGNGKVENEKGEIIGMAEYDLTVEDVRKPDGSPSDWTKITGTIRLPAYETQSIGRCGNPQTDPIYMLEVEEDLSNRRKKFPFFPKLAASPK